MVDLKTYIQNIAEKHRLTPVVLVSLVLSFCLVVGAGLAINYYQGQEITHLTAASRLISVEKGLTRWERQVSRTKLVGAKVAKANFKYKGELAYLNDLQTRFWHKIAVQSSINRSLLGSDAAKQLESSVDAAIDSWHSLQLFHEALLVDEPVKQAISKKDYAVYKKSISTLHSSLVDAIVAHRQLSESARTIQDTSIIVFLVGFCLFFVLALRQHLMLAYPLFYEGLVLRRQFFNGIDSQLGLAVAQQVQQQVPATSTNITIGREEDGKIQLKVSDRLQVSTPYVNNIDGFTTVSDFSKLATFDSDIIEADDVEELVPKEVFMGFDQNQSYYGYVTEEQPLFREKETAGDVEIEEAFIIQGDTFLEPIEPISLTQDTGIASESGAISQNVVNAWFEFSLPDDLLIGGNHPVWISDSGLEALGYPNRSINTFAKLVEIFHPDERFTFLQVLRLHLQDKTGQTPLSLTARLRRADHDYVSVTITAATERATDGTALRIKGEWVHSKAATQPAQYPNPVLLRSADGLMADDLTWQMPIRFFESENEVCNWSPSFAKALGYEPYNMPISSSQVKDLVHPEDLRNLQASINSIIKAYNMIDRFNWQVRMLHATGHYVLVMLQGVVLLDHKRLPDKLAGVMDDIDYQPVPEVKFFASYVQVQHNNEAQLAQTQDFKQRFIKRTA